MEGGILPIGHAHGMKLLLFLISQWTQSE